VTVSRRTLVVAALLAGALLLYWLWPAKSWELRNLPPTAKGPWVAFGDSLTEGFGAGLGGDYPAQLSKALGVPIENLGKSGETSTDGLNRLAEVEALIPRVVLLCFGGNDVLRGHSRERMLANLGTMIDRLQARGSFVVLIGIRSANLLGDENAGGFAALAEEKGTLHVPDILDGIITQPRLMTDYVHPNDAGYAKIAERIAEELRPLLPQLAGESQAP
jgi:acyl-CoA thioesterase I